MKFKTLVKFKTWNCRPQFSRYQSTNNHALQLVSTDGEPIAMASVNPPQHMPPLPDDMICIKDYSENEGMVEALTEAGIIGNHIMDIRSGWVNLKVHKLLVNPES